MSRFLPCSDHGNDPVFGCPGCGPPEPLTPRERADEQYALGGFLLEPDRWLAGEGHYVLAMMLDVRSEAGRALARAIVEVWLRGEPVEDYFIGQELDRSGGSAAIEEAGGFVRVVFPCIGEYRRRHADDGLPF